MKLTKGILAAAMMVGGAWAQNPNVINNVQNQMTAVSQKQTADTNGALGVQSTSTSTPAKKSPFVSAPLAKTAPVTAVKPAATATKKVPAESSKNKLEQVKVIRHPEDIQIEMSTREAVTPTVNKLTSPDRVVVELPATAMATPQSKIPVSASGIKGVRIGVNGKTPPTTSVVVDLEQTISYEISPGQSNKLVLTFHVQDAKQVAARSSATPAVAKAQLPQKAAVKPAVVVPVAAPKPQPAVVSKTGATAPAKSAPAMIAVSTAKPVSAKPAIVANVQVAAQAQAPKVANVPAAPKVGATAKPPVTPAPPKAAVAAKTEAPKAPASAATPAKVTIAASKEEPKPATLQAAKSTSDEKVAPIATTADDSKTPKPEDKKWAMTGKRDPFFSPVVQQASGSGCSTGKKCLEIGQINVRGIVKSEGGFIAVVTNSLNKAYFLHENDPVFNGYVLRITGDSVVFQETYQDKFGKPLTREVTKTVVAPAV
jgi:hypothetical protein